MPKILIVEDNQDILSLLSEQLTSLHYSLETVSDGREAAEYLKQAQYDLIILDWELPGISGVEICKRFRREGGSTPVLMLTAKGTENDKEEGLDAGADDYLTKPFTLRELAARLRALLRRPAQIVERTLKVGDIELDPLKHIVSKGGQELRLARRDFELLELFMRYPGKFFTTDTLLERIWNFDSEASSEAVRTAIKRLRKILDAPSDDENNSIIENVRKIGYRLRFEE